MQREIEAAGISSLTLSGIYELTASVSVPRLAAIEHPLGYLLGQPGDLAGQRAILRATLHALVEMVDPGSVAHLPFEWPAASEVLSLEPPETPPIVAYLRRHPWHIPNFYARRVPEVFQVK